MQLTLEARASDPMPSHLAADSVKPQTVSKAHKAVLELLRGGPIATWQAVHELSHLPISPSRIRSSFPELERKGLVQVVGETESQYGRTCQLWGLASLPRSV